MQIFNTIKLKRVLIAFVFLMLANEIKSQDQSLVRNIYIELDLKQNSDVRSTAISKSYEIALARYLTWITLQSYEEVNLLLNSINPKNYVSGYSIDNEKYRKDKYSALITVNFEQKKLENFLNKKNIQHFSKKGPVSLILPLISFENKLVLWDDPNPWFDIWLRRPLDSNLNLFVLPSGEADDLITLSANDAAELKYFKIKKLANKYAATEVYILIVNLEKNVDVYNYTLNAYNGLTQKKIFNSKEEKILENDLVDKFYTLSDKFANYIDDVWVKENLKNLNKKTLVMVEFSYKKYGQWIDIKRYLSNSDVILDFKIIKMSNKNATLKINVSSQNLLIDDLKDNNFFIDNTSGNLLIDATEISNE